jgi:hypothetical protein
MPLGPSSQRFGHPGSPARIDSGLDCLDRAAPAEILRRCLLAKGDTVGKDRGAFHRNETLTRAKDCSFVRARIAFPSRRLRRGIARGFARLCYRLWRPPTDEESTRSDSTCGDDRAEAFSSLRVAAPVTFSTTESARGQMCRELHDPFLIRNDFLRNKKSTRTMLFLIHYLPTRLSTACPPTTMNCPAFVGLFLECRGGAGMSTGSVIVIEYCK